MGAQDFWSNAGYDPSKSNYGMTSSSLTSAWNKLNPGVSMPAGISFGGSSSSGSGPAYDRVSAVPSWLPKPDLSELADQYAKTGEQFDTKGYDDASEGQQSRLLTTALNAGNNAATDYANRARQAGGSGMGAGLIKAQASVGARKVAGDMELERQKFDASQREKAAGHAASIAQTLGQLRDSYLKTIVDYATKEDSTSADFKSRMAAVDATNAGTAESARQFNWKQPTGGGYQTDSFGHISNLYGMPFRDPTTGLPTSNVANAPTNRQANTGGGIFG